MFHNVSTVSVAGQQGDKFRFLLTITYDKVSGRCEARLVAVDLGETILMACAFNDGTGRQNSCRWKRITHRERKQVATSHFIAECVRRGVKEIVSESIDYGDRLKYKGALVGPRLHEACGFKQEAPGVVCLPAGGRRRQT